MLDLFDTKPSIAVQPQAVLKQCLLLLQYVNTLEANILKSLNAVCNVSITFVVASSISVTSLYAFTGSDSTAAAAAQSSLAAVLTSGSVSSIFGSSFGPVTVSGVATSNATNPGKRLDLSFQVCLLCLGTQFNTKHVL